MFIHAVGSELGIISLSIRILDHFHPWNTLLLLKSSVHGHQPAIFFWALFSIDIRTLAEGLGPAPEICFIVTIKKNVSYWLFD